MKALLCTQHGDPELLEVREVASPEPGAGQLRVDIHAAGVNFPDSLSFATSISLSLRFLFHRAARLPALFRQSARVSKAFSLATR